MYGADECYDNVNTAVDFSSYICFGVCTVCGVVYKGRIVFERWYLGILVCVTGGGGIWNLGL